jgi:hypothetical protein
MNIWTVAIGAAGGLLYGLMSDSKHVWPNLIDVGRHRPLPHIGLIGHAVIGMAAGELVTIIILTSNTVSLTATGPTWSNACAQVLCSFLASSTIGGYTDRRFLRLAIRNAATAPAADPATVRALEVATPCEAYVATGRLTPPLSQIWGTRRLPFVAAAEDVSSSTLSATDSKTRLAVRLVRVPTGAEKRR